MIYRVVEVEFATGDVKYKIQKKKCSIFGREVWATLVESFDADCYGFYECWSVFSFSSCIVYFDTLDEATKRIQDMDKNRNFITSEKVVVTYHV